MLIFTGIVCLFFSSFLYERTKVLSLLLFVIANASILLKCFLTERQMNQDMQNTELVDVGKEWNYYRLSPRRRFLRSLWISLLFVAFALGLIHIEIRLTAFLGIAAALFFGQAVFNLCKWKKQKP